MILVMFHCSTLLLKNRQIKIKNKKYKGRIETKWNSGTVERALALVQINDGNAGSAKLYVLIAET